MNWFQNIIVGFGGKKLPSCGFFEVNLHIHRDKVWIGVLRRTLHTSICHEWWSQEDTKVGFECCNVAWKTVDIKYNPVGFRGHALVHI